MGSKAGPSLLFGRPTTFLTDVSGMASGSRIFRQPTPSQHPPEQRAVGWSRSIHSFMGVIASPPGTIDEGEKSHQISAMAESLGRVAGAFPRWLKAALKGCEGDFLIDKTMGQGGKAQRRR
jgi:hypothetical protein